MMKRVLFGCAISVMCLGFIGCNNSANAVNTPSEEESYSYEIVEVDGESEDGESKESTGGYYEGYEEDRKAAIENGDWTLSYTDDDDNVFCEVLNEIPESFAINEKSTYGTLAGVCEKYSVGFDKKVFNDLFAINYFSPDVYSEMYNQYGEDETIRVVAKLYAIAECFSANSYSIERAQYDSSDPTKIIYYLVDDSGNEITATWHRSSGELVFVNLSTGVSVSAGVNFNDDTVLLAYMVDIMEGYKYGMDSESSEGDEFIPEVNTASKLADMHYEKIKGYEDEIEKAVVNYFECDIESISDSTTNGVEIAIFHMENGKTAKYVGGSSDALRPQVFDTNNPDIYIWQID